MPWVAAAVAVATAIASAVSESESSNKAQQTITANQNAALQQWMNVNIPDPAQQKVVYDTYRSTGQLDPRLLQAIKQDPSQFEGVIQDQKAVQAQQNALSQLENIGNSGGLRLQDQADLQKLQSDSDTRARGNRLAISDQMARRGLSGSGFDSAAQLSNIQDQAGRDSSNSLQIAAQAQARALQAIEGAGSLGGQIEAQRFGEQAQKANAADAIAKFNTQNLRDVNAANAAAQNYAQEYNLTNSQNLANKNVELANAQQEHNKGLAQQQFENQLRVAAGKTGQYNQLGSQLSGLQLQQGKGVSNTISNVGNSAVGAVTADQNKSFWKDYMDSNKSSANPVAPVGGTGQRSPASDSYSGINFGPQLDDEDKNSFIYNFNRNA